MTAVLSSSVPRYRLVILVPRQAEPPIASVRKCMVGRCTASAIASGQCYFMAARAPNPCSSKHRLSTLSKKGLTMFDSLKKNPKPNSFSPTCNFPVSPFKVNRREGQGGLGTRSSLTIGLMACTRGTRRALTTSQLPLASFKPILGSFAAALWIMRISRSNVSAMRG